MPAAVTWFFAAALSAVLALGALLLWAAQSTPEFHRRDVLDTALRDGVEGARRHARAVRFGPAGEPSPWAEPGLARLPRELVAFFLTELECPDFLTRTTPLKTALPTRLYWLVVPPKPGDARCADQLAQSIVDALALQTPLQRWWARGQVASALEREALVATALETEEFAEGVIGPEAAAQHFFGERLWDVPVSALAELALALPPYRLSSELERCANAPLLLRARNSVLARAGLPPELSRNPLECLKKDRRR